MGSKVKKIMITKLILKNFQGYRKARIKFHRNVNVIVGKTQSGKTSLFRAIGLCAFNRPLGSLFKNKFAGEDLSIKIVTDLHSVTLKKSEKESQYILKNLFTEVTAKFRKFKSSVPDSIKEALNLDKSLTYQDQLDPYFLINSSSSVFEKKINSVLKSEDIEKWRGFTKVRIKDKRVILKEFMKRVGDAERFLQKYKGLDEIKSLIFERVALSNELEVQNKYYISLKELRKYIRKKKKLTLVQNRYLEFLGEFKQFVADGDEERLLKNKVNFLLTLRNHMLSKRKNREKLSILKLRYIKFFEEKEICPFCFSVLKAANIKKGIDNLL